MAKEVLTQEEKVKAIPGKEMKEVIISMNSWLAEKEREEIVVDKSKTDTINNLFAPIITAIEADEAADLPEDVITFFNDHLVGLSEEEEAEEPEEEKEGAPTPPAKKGKEKKEKKEKKPKKEKALKSTETYNKLVEMLSKDKMKMGAVKKILGNTYYGLAKKYPDVFAKDDLGYFHVIGSDAEKIVIAPPIKKEKVKKEKVKKEKAPAKEKPAAKAKTAAKPATKAKATAAKPAAKAKATAAKAKPAAKATAEK